MIRSLAGGLLPAPGVSASRRTTRSGFWLAYAEVFPSRTHRCRDKSEGETRHVEGGNCNLRQRLGRFVRKTSSFSKCERMHEAALRRVAQLYDLSLTP